MAKQKTKELRKGSRTNVSEQMSIGLSLVDVSEGMRDVVDKLHDYTEIDLNVVKKYLKDVEGKLAEAKHLLHVKKVEK